MAFLLLLEPVSLHVVAIFVNKRNHVGLQINLVFDLVYLLVQKSEVDRLSQNVSLQTID